VESKNLLHRASPPPSEGEGKGGGDIIGLSFGCGYAALFPLWLDFDNTKYFGERRP